RERPSLALATVLLVQCGENLEELAGSKNRNNLRGRANQKNKNSDHPPIAGELAKAPHTEGTPKGEDLASELIESKLVARTARTTWIR
ncbi:unnamed protein product, partial [Amoebophrya sp. A25]